MFRPDKKIKLFFNYILGPLLGVWLFYSLFKQVKEQPNLQESVLLIRQAPFGDHAIIFWLVILMVFINWGLEARKWQVVLYKLERISFFTAYKAVLSGLTLSLNTPNRIGEYGGRILYVAEGNRIRAISLSIAGSISQLIITVLMGCGGLVFLIYDQPQQVAVMGLSYLWLKTLLFISSCSVLMLLLFYFKLSWVIRLIEKIPAFAKLIRHISVLDEFTPNLLLRLLSLSFLRYLVFVLQYILLLKVMHVEIWWVQCFWIISILFLVLAIVPSFAIADLGIRGKFSTELLSLYSVNIIGIIGTTFGIWLINLFIPALAGSLLILGTKLFRER